MARDGKMTNKMIESEFLNETMEAKIYFPKDIDTLYETQICLMQDGNDYYQMGRVATISDRLHAEGAIVNAVFVGVHYIDRADRMKKYHPNGAQFEAYQKFITDELVPMVDELLPLNPLGHHRTIMGDSLAGTLALVTSVKHPNIFKQAILQSPLIDSSVEELVKSVPTPNIGIYHSIGLKEKEVYTSDKQIMDFVKPNQNFAKYLSENFPNYKYVEIPNGNHTWKYWQEELPDVIEYVLG